MRGRGGGGGGKEGRETNCLQTDNWDFFCNFSL